MDRETTDNLIRILWIALRVEHPETARLALLTLGERDLDALAQALGAAVEQQPDAPSLAAAILPRIEWLEERARLLRPTPPPPRLATVGGRRVGG